MFSKSISEITLDNLKSQPEDYWVSRGDEATQELFQQMALRVPAYQNFLQQHGLSRDNVKTIGDIRRLPTLDKNNYLRTNPVPSLCWDGNFSCQPWVISSTSGSTGEPFYFPRQAEQDLQYALTAELYFKSNFQIDKKTTLYIIAFPMGVWIGGVFTYQAATAVARRTGYPLSVITTGINVDAVINAVQKLGPLFDQVIIGAYAPFLKDIIDQGVHLGIDWTQFNLKFIFSAETFSEEFREYIYRKTGVKEYYTSSLNHYGTVDMGTMAHETPLSILIRKQAINNQALYNDMFGQTAKQPTLCQFIPEMFNFYQQDDRLYCSANSGLPLINYDLKDLGGVIGFNQMVQIMKQRGLNLWELARETGIEETVWHIPFVFVYERADFSVSYYAFQLYPESVRKALIDQQLEECVSGKFLMDVIYGDEFNQILQINVELKVGVAASDQLEAKVAKLIFNQLLNDSSEFAKTYEEFGEKVKPSIILWQYGDQKYFKPGIKQQWVQKR